MKSLHIALSLNQDNLLEIPCTTKADKSALHKASDFSSEKISKPGRNFMELHRSVHAERINDQTLTALELHL